MGSQSTRKTDNKIEGGVLCGTMWSYKIQRLQAKQSSSGEEGETGQETTDLCLNGGGETQ